MLNKSELIKIQKQFLLKLAEGLNLLSLNSNMYSNIYQKRKSIINKIDNTLKVKSTELSELQSQLLTLKPTEKTFKKNFTEIQNKLVNVTTYISRATNIKVKLESTLEGVLNKAINSNKFKKYEWGTKDRSSGVKNGKRDSKCPQVKLHDLILDVADIIDTLGIESFDFIDKLDEVEEKELCWSFQALEYHCFQKGSNRVNTPFTTLTASETYSKYKENIGDLMETFNCYVKPIEE